jgi:hypothetical protein
MYKDQFTPADLSDADDYLRYCMRYGIVIDFDVLDPEIVADLYILKSMMVARYQSQIDKN